MKKKQSGKEEVEDEKIVLKIKPATCWFCIHANEELKNSARCKKCILGTKIGFRKAGDKIMNKREKEYA